MEPQNTMQPQLQPQQPEKKRKVWVVGIILVTLAILVGACFGVYSWQHSQVEALQTEVNTLQQEKSNLQKQLKASEAAEEKTSDQASATSATSVTDQAMIEAAVQSVCSSELYTCSSVKITKQTDKYASVSVIATSQTPRQDGQAAPKSVLVKKNVNGSWQWVISTPEAAICGMGTDQPDAVAFCKS